MWPATVKRGWHLTGRLIEVWANADVPQQLGNGDASECCLGFESTLLVREQANFDLFGKASIFGFGHNPLLKLRESSV